MSEDQIKLVEEINNLQDVVEIEKFRLKIECEKISQGWKIESEKLSQGRRIESEKLRLERLKICCTIFTIFLPLLIAGVALYRDKTLQAEKAKADFQIKAAEIVMTADSPASAENKAKILADMFPDWLPESFRDTFKKYNIISD